MTRISANRYHDISVGHRVVGHEGKCRHLHGHNYRIHFFVQAEKGRLDEVGRVLDFSVIKTKLCMWLEDEYDHKMLIWERDPMLPKLVELTEESIVVVPYNPTAENIGQYLLNVIAPQQLKGTGCVLTKVVIEETRKCHVTVEL